MFKFSIWSCPTFVGCCFDGNLIFRAFFCSIFVVTVNLLSLGLQLVLLVLPEKAEWFPPIKLLGASCDPWVSLCHWVG